MKSLEHEGETRPERSEAELRDVAGTPVFEAISSLKSRRRFLRELTISRFRVGLWVYSAYQAVLPARTFVL